MSIQQATQVYRVLSDVNRSKMVMLMAQKERTVGELEKALGISQSGTSQHLKLLQEAGIVRFRKYGTFRFYSLRKNALKKAMHFFDRFWDVGLEKMKQNLEKNE